MLQLEASSGPTLAQLVMAIVGAIPLLGIIGWTAVKILSPLTQALGRRIGGAGDAALVERRVDQLAQEMDVLRAQVQDAQERLDFTERMLAQGRQQNQLPRG
jgi:hypothetical protein